VRTANKVAFQVYRIFMYGTVRVRTWSKFFESLADKSIRDYRVQVKPICNSYSRVRSISNRKLSILADEYRMESQSAQPSEFARRTLDYEISRKFNLRSLVPRVCSETAAETKTRGFPYFFFGKIPLNLIFANFSFSLSIPFFVETKSASQVSSGSRTVDCQENIWNINFPLRYRNESVRSVF